MPRRFAQGRPTAGDKTCVSRLVDNARRILDTAFDAGENGLETSDWTIFFGPEGGLEMIAGTDMPLDSLAWSHGARMVWQVKHERGGVSVEGRAGAGGERCRLEMGSPRETARMLLGSGGLYQLIPAA